MDYGEFLAYVDESGDHGLRNVNPLFPVFVLSFCVFHKETYAGQCVPALMRLKFKHFGHEMTVFHELDIRKQTGEFSFLRNTDRREAFLSDLSELVRTSDFAIIAVVIDRRQLVSQCKHPNNPYEIAMRHGLERFHSYLRERDQEKKTTHVVFEKRGAKEDRDLELAFRRVCAGANGSGEPLPFSIRFASKKANSCGLQLADLTARPIGLRHMRPGQANRAFDILHEKMYRKNGAGG